MEVKKASIAATPTHFHNGFALISVTDVVFCVVACGCSALKKRKKGAAKSINIAKSIKNACNPYAANNLGKMAIAAAPSNVCPKSQSAKVRAGLEVWLAHAIVIIRILPAAKAAEERATMSVLRSCAKKERILPSKNKIIKNFIALRWEKRFDHQIAGIAAIPI